LNAQVPAPKFAFGPVTAAGMQYLGETGMTALEQSTSESGRSLVGYAPPETAISNADDVSAACTILNVTRAFDPD
jgi:hypothetical protein